jgi:hypothetical protein
MKITLSKSQWQEIGKKTGWIKTAELISKKAQGRPDKNYEETHTTTERKYNTYFYHIDLDERGYFYADVRKNDENTVFEIKGFDIFEDGFMKHKKDMNGLKDYLIHLKIMNPSDKLKYVG